MRSEGKIYCDNWLNNNLPDKSVQLIIADPPYYKTKGDFDFIWNSFEDYLKDVKKWAIECKRLLADNGTLFWWGNSKKVAYSQIILDKYFNLENSMVWRKIDSIQYQYYSIDLSRSFNTHNERLLMYSNCENDNNTFAEYLKTKISLFKIKHIDIQKLYPSKTGGLTGCVTNWVKGYNVMTEKQYMTLQKEYPNVFDKDYDFLYNEYDKNRRYFMNELKLEEILEFSQQSNISKNYNHDTIKPEKLTRALILTCSRENDLVLVPFAGSGTECAMAVKEKRRFIGFDIEQKYVDMGNKRVEKIRGQPTLF